MSILLQQHARERHVKLICRKKREGLRVELNQAIIVSILFCLDE